MLQKVHTVITLVLAIAVAVLSYTFVLKGNAYLGEDGRMTIVLTEAEKAQVLSEMRAMLEGAQAITEALSVNDMDAVATAASSLGMVVANADSPDLIAKLPIEVKTLGLGTHAGFDELANLAQVSEDPLEVLAEFSNLMLNCTTCHASYRIAIEDFDE
jgi:hypothetical protein